MTTTAATAAEIRRAEAARSWIDGLTGTIATREHAKSAAKVRARIHGARWDAATARDLACELRDEAAHLLAHAALTAAALGAQTGAAGQLDAERRDDLDAALRELGEAAALAHRAMDRAVARLDRRHDEVAEAIDARARELAESRREAEAGAGELAEAAP